MTDRKEFAKKVTIICDTREQCNQHIMQYLYASGIATEHRKLDFGDYSFSINGKSFERSCVIERKGSIDELYGNITTKNGERIKKELDAAAKNARHIELILEGVTSEQELKAFEIPEPQMIAQNRKVKRIGETVYSELRSLRSGNRCGLQVSFVKKEDAAKKILEIFYFYYRNYEKAITPMRKETNHAG